VTAIKREMVMSRADVVRFVFDADLETLRAYAILGALAEYDRAEKAKTTDALFADLRGDMISPPEGTARPDGGEAQQPSQGGDSSTVGLSPAATVEEQLGEHRAGAESADREAAGGPLVLGSSAPAPNPGAGGGNPAAADAGSVVSTPAPALDPDPPLNHLTPAFRCDDCDYATRRLTRLNEHTIDDHERSPHLHEKKRRTAP
jgi:hypothetical protein